MNLSGLKSMLAMGPQPTPPGTQPDPRGQILGLVGWLIPMVVIVYLLMIRPQRQSQKKHAELLKNLKAGDRILTSSGIVGVVVNVKENTLTVRSADSKFEITKSAVSQVTERSGEASQS